MVLWYCTWEVHKIINTTDAETDKICICYFSYTLIIE
nr:MAG TPA: hypothetical protein [Caudoviricetes sp.]